jgi:UPF0716 protein FxsA
MAGAVLLVLLVLPFVELGVFIMAVGWVGILPALAAIIVLGVAGSLLIKHQGLGVWRRADARLQAGEVPSAEVVNGLLVLIAGALLILPGFVSDVLAFALLLPPVRAAVRALLFKRFEQRVSDTFAGPMGLAFGGRRDPMRVDTGQATYGGVVDVHEAGGRQLDDPSPDAPGRQ